MQVSDMNREKEGRILAGALRAKRHQLALGLIDNIRDTPKWDKEYQARAKDLDDFATREFHAFIDYLAEYFENDDINFSYLYIGEKLKVLFDPDLDVEAARAQRQTVTERDLQTLQSGLRDQISEEAMALFTGALEKIHGTLCGEARKTLNVLFIGDCIFQDILAFLTAPLLSDGVAVSPAYATSKNPHQMAADLKALAAQKFHLIFYSPFTYEQSLEFAIFQQWRQSGMSGGKIKEIVDKVIGETTSALDLIADLFDCPVYVHNSSNIRREESASKRRVKNMATANVRRKSSDLVNTWLTQYIQEKNAATYKHLFPFDEMQLIEAHGEFELGAYYYKTDLQHPCAFGRAAAEVYRDIILTHALMVGKKLVVCDLDNTLWDGIIGEGAVKHHKDRQQVLKDLMAKGIVLAINSKNDPANVHWDGGLLNENDFVYSDINWEPKVTGFRRIREALNLKPKDYIFVDDRADERDMANQMYPEIFCMDAEDARTWSLMARWRDILEDNPEMDRTKMYKEREQRKQFIQETETDRADEEAMFMSLDLKLKIHEAGQSDLKRVAELINRTNQWNLQGSRTSYKDVCDYHASKDHLILLGDAGDRFGDQGTVCVLIADLFEDRVELPFFVLSCRVFGYKIETAMLNRVKEAAGGRKVVGYLKETPQNQPCRSMYPDNGFKEEDGVWIYNQGGASIPNPAWLTIV